MPIGVRPRRGGRAAGLILTLILIGGYYFIFVYGIHMAELGRVSPWLGVWAADIVAAAVGLFFLGRIENVRKPNPIIAWVESLWLRRARKSHAANGNGNGQLAPSSAAAAGAVAATPISNGPIALASAAVAARIERQTRVEQHDGVSDAGRFLSASSSFLITCWCCWSGSC